ncbi:MAG: abortive infection family protein [Bdellovibrionales bacterium]|nr:abortive infection family protein [Bdellovibrionales bacterium]
MSLDWGPGIKEACAHWKDAPMLHQTFEALERAIIDGNDTCIDCAKSIVEVFCRVILDELDSPSSPVRPTSELPKFGEWVTAAIRVLKLGENQNLQFRKLVSQHHKMTTLLGDLRNKSGPVSHGRDAFLERLSGHHRRSAIISADAIVTFLHQAYLEAELDLVKTRLPYESERLADRHQLVDQSVAIRSSTGDDGLLAVEVALPGGDLIPLKIEPSRLLYQVDREAYYEALKAAQTFALAEQAGIGGI